MILNKNCRRTILAINTGVTFLCCLLWLSPSALSKEGEPVAIRYWPNGCSSIETMWNLHIAFDVDATSRSAMPRQADLEFVDDFWAASGTDALVLDRKPNELEAVLKPSSECKDPSPNSVRLNRVALTNPTTKKSLFVNAVSVDGVTIVDSNKNSVSDLLGVLKDSAVLPKELHSVDALLIDDTKADPSDYESLQSFIRSRIVVLRSNVEFNTVGDTAIEPIVHNTLSISQSKPGAKTRWVKLGERPWEMTPDLSELFAKKEQECKKSRDVFAALSVNQLNFRPSNGTHTPRWNTEHMMGRELLFFSQIYHAVDSSIPIMDLNPKQMPPDYRPAHSEWSGLEESKQMERVEAFTRRFAFLLEGMELTKKAKGSAFWTPKALLVQMDAHYREHTANVVKKKDLPDWPTN